MHQRLLSAFIIVSTLFIFCTKISDNNPYLPGYTGNYAFAVRDSMLPATMEVFKPYYVSFTKGTDAFASFGASGGIDAVLDTSVINDVVDDDTITLYFKKAFQGDVVLRAVRPNGTVLLDTIKNVVVINPYALSLPAVVAQGELISVRIVRLDGAALSTGFTVEWVINGTPITPQAATAVYRYAPTGNQTQIVSAYLRNGGTTGDSLVLGPANVQIAGGRPGLANIKINGNDTIALGSALAITGTLTDPDNSPYKLYVKCGNWRDSSSLQTFQFSLNTAITKPVTDTTLRTFTIFTVDNTGLSSDTITKTISIRYTLPAITPRPDTLIVNKGDTSTVSVTATNAATVVWQLDSVAFDTTSGDSVGFYLDDTLNHRISVYGIDQYGYSGAPTSFYVKARQFGYTIVPVLFPLGGAAKSSIIWHVTVNDTGRFNAKNGMFTWIVSPTGYDSLRYGGIRHDSLILYYRDSNHATVSVHAADSVQSSSSVYSRNLVVHRYAPIITFKADTVVARLNESTVIDVHAADSNSGSIDSIYYDFDGDNIFETRTAGTDTNHAKTYTTPDTFIVRAYCKDNDQFSSNVDSAVLIVKAFKPYLSPRADTTVNINSSITYTVIGHVADTGVTIEKYLWDWTNDGVFDDSTPSGNAAHSYTDSGIKEVAVKCRDSKKVLSDSDTFRVTVSPGRPMVTAITPDTVWIGDDTTYAIAAADVNVGGSVVSYYIKWDAAASYQSGTTASLKHAYTSAGTKHLSIYVVDNDGKSSNVYSDSVVVKLGIPTISTIALDTTATNFFINDIRQFTITGSDPNGHIDSIKISWNSDTLFDSIKATVSQSATFAHAFSASGTDSLRIRVIDDNGFIKDSIYSIAVRRGKPVTTAILPDTGIFINDNYTYIVAANDTNGTIGRYYVSWDSGATYTTQTIAVFSKSYSSAGLKIIKAYVKDNDSIPSDTLRDSVRVRICAPVIDSIKIDPPGNSLFVLDNRKYRVFVRDTNGYVKKIYYAWNNGSTADDSLTINLNSSIFDTTISHAYDTVSSGSRTIKIWLRDDDGIASNATKDTTVTVRKGIPVADSLKPDTVWCVDNNNFAISWHDTNGTVADSFKISWDGGSSWTKNATGVFSKSFDTTTAKTTNQTAKIMVKDSDGFWSVAKDEAVTVRLGRPRVWGATFGDSIQWKTATTGFDTMFYVYKGAETPIMLSTYDSNGTISRYYWDFNDDNAGVTTATSQPYLPTLIAGTAYKYAAWCKDGDSLNSGKIVFYVYPDEPPPTTTTTSDAIASVRKISWKNKDVKDGTETQFKIIVHFEGSNGYNDPNENNATDLISDWKPGTAYETGTTGYEFGYTYTPNSGSGTYYYQVISKDARGSKSYSPIGGFGF